MVCCNELREQLRQYITEGIKSSSLPEDFKQFYIDYLKTGINIYINFDPIVADKIEYKFVVYSSKDLLGFDIYANSELKYRIIPPSPIDKLFCLNVDEYGYEVSEKTASLMIRKIQTEFAFVNTFNSLFIYDGCSSPQLRLSLKYAFDRLLSVLKENRVINDFIVICDEVTNTSEIIKNGKIVAYFGLRNINIFNNISVMLGNDGIVDVKILEDY